MGRLDDAAKRKVVELRRAGLSFRKIKAVLELENIKVSAQAIYLFLKEFQGKPRQEGAGSGTTQAAAATSVDVGDGAGRQMSWPDQQVWNLIRDTPRTAGSEQQDGRKEDSIRIVSVTSLARGTQHGGPQMVGTGPVLGASMRRKAPMSPASSSILVARKRLLDKALLHKARMREMSTQAGQQVGQLYGRGQACFQGNDVRKVTVLPQSPTLSLTTPRLPQPRRTLEDQPVAGLPRRTPQQKTGPPARSLHPPFQREPPPCTTIRPPNLAPAPPAGQVASATVRSQLPPNSSPRKDPQGRARTAAGGAGCRSKCRRWGRRFGGWGWL
ncbi:hypothetical protein AAFF_G00419760 [Aldrovandia affinis]|uniref:Uncharacterized protein n=1 Tax=Aldrovandia affinis TaxID=143900 RepID=A0AAD7SA38_9TELE|nr:hypothetical protein AAFF_G00419760 [Aldrovandia affinis]